MAYALSRLGPARLAHSAYRMSSLFPGPDAPGAYPGPVLGSDFPVEPPNPFHGMYAAVTRLDPGTGTSPAGGGGWYPQEALSVEQAVRGFTRNAAYGWFREGVAGAVEVGMWADFVVLDRDVLGDAGGEGLRDVQVRETWVGGRKVYALEDEEGEPGLGEELVAVVRRFITWILKYRKGDADQEL
jgi:predicted amidohydrolase YtcJ